jgi:hypothetical protein
MHFGACPIRLARGQKIMSNINACQSCAPYAARTGVDDGRAQGRPQTRSASNAALDYRAGRSRSTQAETSYQLTLRTEDGDVVTISAKAVQSSQSTDYASLSRGRDGVSASAYRGRQRESSLEVSIQVEGDLSQEEIEDIRKLTSTLAKATRQVNRGDTGGALRTSLSAAKPDDTIAAFDFAYQQTRQVEEIREQQVSYLA